MTDKQLSPLRLKDIETGRRLEREQFDVERKALLDEIERLRAGLSRIAAGWYKPMQMARETLEGPR